MCADVFEWEIRATGNQDMACTTFVNSRRKVRNSREGFARSRSWLLAPRDRPHLSRIHQVAGDVIRPPEFRAGATRNWRYIRDLGFERQPGACQALKEFF